MEQYKRIPFGFDITQATAIDKRLVLTREQMLDAENTMLLPDQYFCICVDDGRIYFYDRTAEEVSPETGKFVQSEHKLEGSLDDAIAQIEALNDRLDSGEFVTSADLSNAIPGALQAALAEQSVNGGLAVLDGNILVNVNNHQFTIGDDNKIWITEIDANLDEE